jgi:AcrR family transcriptional regulator
VALTERGTRTRDALLTAARDVFERDGFAAARVTDIADGAGVAHGTFYTHFKDKREAFEAVVDGVRDELHDVPEHADDPAAAIAAANRAYLDGHRRHARLMAVVEQVATLDDGVREARLRRARDLAERNARAIRRLQADGRADRALDPDLAALALTTMVSRTAILAEQLGDVDLDALEPALTRLWTNALRLEP